MIGLGHRPIALTCGEPAGIGAEIAVLARLALPDLPFFWLGDPRHLPQGTGFTEIASPDQAALVPKGVLPVLAHRFAGVATAGHPDPAAAGAVLFRAGLGAVLQVRKVAQASAGRSGARRG